ncbi:MAG: Phosphate transport system permease protein PstA [uncultured Thermomicrobiales bacterium]|uniref:Phosphate transport system permease protein PstA n=1 Tax=uncultured Thermomicrobiales bacterium TaxID=1645740 RepID=A0A6J4TVF9_9BACT|nr:MAG: Phosphate transport system permease protein PstA [uncultured Thermomicrobiales bacterium]
MSAAVGEDLLAADAGGGRDQLRARQRRATAVSWVFLAAVVFAVVVLLVLLVAVAYRGVPSLSWSLLSSKASRNAESAGLQTALFGTLWVISLTAIIALPVGIGAAIYLEEYAPRNWWTRALQTNIANLAGVPSVVYGLLGLGIFANFFGFGRSIITGALTMALLILPVIIIASQEAIRAVPLSLRQGAYALGATPWQVSRHHVLPVAMPGILTGTILALSRAIGETAPLLVAGAAAYLTYNPDSLTDGFTALPIQIYNWTDRPQQEFKDLAAAGIIILLVVLIGMNAGAIYLRHRFSKKTRW